MSVAVSIVKIVRKGLIWLHPAKYGVVWTFVLLHLCISFDYLPIYSTVCVWALQTVSVVGFCLLLSHRVHMCLAVPYAAGLSTQKVLHASCCTSRPALVEDRALGCPRGLQLFPESLLSLPSPFSSSVGVFQSVALSFSPSSSLSLQVKWCATFCWPSPYGLYTEVTLPFGFSRLPNFKWSAKGFLGKLHLQVMLFVRFYSFSDPEECFRPNSKFTLRRNAYPQSLVPECEDCAQKLAEHGYLHAQRGLHLWGCFPRKKTVPRVFGKTFFMLFLLPRLVDLEASWQQCPFSGSFSLRSWYMKQNCISEQTGLWMIICPCLSLHPGPTYTARRD